ncbi:MAG TPA: hypothetical protein VF103_09415 [Polyangiaceae bacterium]
MANEALVQAIKDIVARAKEGDLDGSYRGYRELFADPAFKAHRVEDQRQALKLMILKKGAPEPPTPAMVEAHAAAIERLTELVSAHNEPADYELLGVCHVVVGNEESASNIFKAALVIERERDPSSTLCGSLMKRVSML